MNRYWLIFCLGIFGACAGFPLSGAKPQEKKKEPVELPVAPVEIFADHVTRTYPARVVPIAKVNLISRVSGEILEQNFANGDVVKAGQQLYLLDSVKYEAVVKNAEAKVAEYKAKSAYAASNYERNRQLAGSNAVSQDSLENALSNRNTSSAALAAAEADLEAARDDLAHCRILAPIEGKVGTSFFTPGNYVTPTSGTLVTLVQTSPIRVRFSISNRDYLAMFGGRGSHIREKGLVTVTLADGSALPEHGCVEYVENEASEETDSVQVFARFENANRILKPGGTVAISLQNREGLSCSAVPPTAVLQDIKGAYVWVLTKGDVVEKRYIRRGRVTEGRQLVDSGLASGELVVADGVHKVRSGDRIRPVRKEN